MSAQAAKPAASTNRATRNLRMRILFRNGRCAAVRVLWSRAEHLYPLHGALVLTLPDLVECDLDRIG